MLQNSALYIVSTPIGNLEDITLRALRVLREVDVILCEDTRRSRKLLTHYSIHSKKLISFHAYNQYPRIKEAISLLKSNKTIALITDSGTPGISDPATLLVAECIKENIPVIPIPGPTAFIAALSCSGLPTNEFVFIGFLPKKLGKIKKKLMQLKDFKKTVLFYESPYRLLKTLAICNEIFGGEVRCVIARELTKKFEQFIRGTINEVITVLKNQDIKGEIVVGIKP